MYKTLLMSIMFQHLTSKTYYVIFTYLNFSGGWSVGGIPILNNVGNAQLRSFSSFFLNKFSGNKHETFIIYALIQRVYDHMKNPTITIET